MRTSSYSRPDPSSASCTLASAGRSLRRPGTATVLLLSLLLGNTATAQVYKITDPERGVTFSDRPDSAPGSTVEKIEVREPNTAPPPPDAPPSPRPRSEAREEAPEPSVTITSPEDEATIAMGPGNFTVSAAVEPPLRQGETLILTMDGQAYGAAQTSRSWAIEGAMRGPHDLVVRRVGRNGDTIASSEPVRVYVLRPSILNR